MAGKKVFTHGQLNSLFYASERKFGSIAEQIRYAENYPERNEKPGEMPEAVRENRSTFELFTAQETSLSEEEFEQLCDSIPVDLDEMARMNLTDTITESEGISATGERKCSLFRHLNSLVAEEHEHTFFEFCYVWKGACVQFSDGFFRDIQEGGFIITPPGMRHRVRVNTKDSIVFNILISKEMFRNILFETLAADHSLARYLRRVLTDGDAKKPYVFHFDAQSEPNRITLRKVMFALVIEYYQGGNNPLIINGFISHIFGTIMRADDRMHFDNDYFIDMLDYINGHYTDVTLNRMAEKFGYSEAYLSRLIKQMTGRTFSELVRYMRISYAETLLVGEGLTLRQAAEQAGYYDYAGFVRAFEKEKGVKPSEYVNA